MQTTMTQRPGHDTQEPLGNRGRVTAVRGSVVDLEFLRHLPALGHEVRTGRDEAVVVEVAAHLSPTTVRAIALTPTQGLARGDPAIDMGATLQTPVGERLLGRMFNVFGETIDNGSPFEDGEHRSIHRHSPPLVQQATTLEVLETGIKAIDVLTPLERGGKAGLFGGAGGGQDRVDHRDDPQHGQPIRRREHLLRHRRALSRGGRTLCLDARGRRTRQHRHGLWPDGRTARRTLPGRSLGPDHGRVFPRRCAPGCAAAHRQHLPLYSGRRRSLGPDGPTALAAGLPADAGRRTGRTPGPHLQHAFRAITAVQAVYVPADDFTDPAVVHTFTHLSSSIVLSRAKRASQGLYPAIDPLQSESKMLMPHIVGQRHYSVARAIRETLAKYDELKDVIAMLGLEELSREDRRVVNRARRLERFLTQPFYTTEQFTGQAGRSVPREVALDGFERILDDEFAESTEQILYMIGAVDEAVEKGAGPENACTD